MTSMPTPDGGTGAAHAVPLHDPEAPFAVEGEVVRLLHRDAGRLELEALRERIGRLPDGADRARALEILSMGLTVWRLA